MQVRWVRTGSALPMAKLSDRILKALVVPPGRKDMFLFDNECRGLGVRVTAKGTKVFIAQWMDPTTKRKVREPLGVWGSITIDQARVAVRSRLGDVARGIDPVAERRRRQEEAESENADRALTVDALVDKWAKLHLAARRPRYATEAPRTVRAALKDHLKRPARTLSRSSAVEAIDSILSAGKSEMARQSMGNARSCFAWALRRGYVTTNPFADLPLAITKSERDRVLTDDEVAEVWTAAGTLPYPFGPFFRLALLTLQRRDEVAGMRWSEISADGLTWTIPAARMKNDRPHDVHLTQAARDVLASIPSQVGPKGKPIDLVFTTTGKTPISGYSRAKTTLDAAIVAARAKAAKGAAVDPEKLTPWRLHDFRRTGVSRLAAMGVDSIVADKLLAHKPAKLRGVASVYQRHDFAVERRKALEVWADDVAGDNTALVLSLRAS